MLQILNVLNLHIFRHFDPGASWQFQSKHTVLSCFNNWHLEIIITSIMLSRNTQYLDLMGRKQLIKKENSVNNVNLLY